MTSQVCPSVGGRAGPTGSPVESSNAGRATAPLVGVAACASCESRGKVAAAESPPPVRPNSSIRGRTQTTRTTRMIRIIFGLRPPGSPAGSPPPGRLGSAGAPAGLVVPAPPVGGAWRGCSRRRLGASARSRSPGSVSVRRRRPARTVRFSSSSDPPPDLANKMKPRHCSSGPTQVPVTMAGVSAGLNRKNPEKWFSLPTLTPSSVVPALPASHKSALFRQATTLDRCNHQDPRRPESLAASGQRSRLSELASYSLLPNNCSWQ
jgi:hypothetical protein